MPVKTILLASLAYLLSFALVLVVVSPVQAKAFPHLQGEVSLMFLPHGVRVLAAWLLGWRSILALAPAALIVQLYMLGPDGITPATLALVMIGVTVAPVTLWALGRAGVPGLSADAPQVCWRCLMAAGFVVSVLNALLSNLVRGAPFEHYVGYLIGDFFGLFFLMLLMLAAARLVWRRA